MRPQGKSKQEALNLFTLDKGKDNAAECTLCKDEHVTTHDSICGAGIYCHTLCRITLNTQLPTATYISAMSRKQLSSEQIWW